MPLLAGFGGRLFLCDIDNSEDNNANRISKPQWSPVKKPAVLPDTASGKRAAVKEAIAELHQQQEQTIMVDNPADIAYDETGMTSPTTYGGYDYGAAVQAEAPVSDGRGQAEILERQGGASAQDGNRPGVPGTLGGERGNLRQLYLRERHTVSSAPELYRIEDCVTPAAGSEAERIQSRFRKEYGLGDIDDNGYIVLHDELCATAYATYYADQLYKNFG